MLSAAMAPDGHFAVAWVDSAYDSTWRPDRSRLDLYIRFFDKDANPLTDAYKIPKILDTTWVNCHALDMDSAGNTVLVWVEGRTLSNTKLSKLRFISFTPDGIPAGTPKTLYSDLDLDRPLSVSLSNNGMFAMSFETKLNDSSGRWIQRLDLHGNSLNFPFIAHDTLPDNFPGLYTMAKVAVNESEDVVITWLHFIESGHNYPLYQVFDADDYPMDWAPLGHRVDNADSLAGACSPYPYWLDNDRFVVFWTDYLAPRPTPNLPWLARVFDDRGLAPQPIRTVMWGDSLHTGSPLTPFSMDISSANKFSCTYNRSYWYPIDTLWPQSHSWEHQVGFLGGIVGNEPWRNTTVFEYSPAYGSDTVWSMIWDSRYSFRLYLQVPAVACSDDRIVWVYTRFQTDTVFEAYAIVSDWDMGVGVAEPVTPITHLEIANPIGSSITLRYSNCPNGFRASVYDASGRKIDIIESSGES
ncbi:hypothetical protein GX441_05060, partial [bacterium]|nr:hypothetical protein [bacterium]